LGLCVRFVTTGGRTWLESGWGLGSETSTEWKARLMKTALALDETTVRDAMGSLKRRAAEVAASGGAWVKGD